MTTTNDLIERTRRHLYSGETRDARDKITDAIDADDETLILTHNNGGATNGSTVAIGLEELHVWDRTNSTLTVERGDGGSTAASHAAGALAYVNPRFSSWSILQSINEELQALSAEGLYRVTYADLEYLSGTDAYDLTGVTEVLDVLSVEFDPNDGTERWSTLEPSQWMLRRTMPTTEFASGLSITVNGYVEPGPMRVVYKAPFAALSTLADNVETVTGLAASAHDILPLGAGIRLTIGNEISRNSLDQYDTRRADEVGAGARLGQMRMLMALRADRIASEKARLYAKYPVIHR